MNFLHLRNAEMLSNINHRINRSLFFLSQRLTWGIHSCSICISVTDSGSFETKSLRCLEKSENNPTSRCHILILMRNKWYCFYTQSWYKNSSELFKCDTRTFNFQLPTSSHMYSYFSVIRLLYGIAWNLYCQPRGSYRKSWATFFACELGKADEGECDGR